MPQHQIFEGTPAQIAGFLGRLSTSKRYRLVELEEAESTMPELDDKAKAAIALLDTWIGEGVTADEATQMLADQEVEAFKRNMNANRATLDERQVYP